MYQYSEPKQIEMTKQADYLPQTPEAATVDRTTQVGALIVANEVSAGVGEQSAAGEVFAAYEYFAPYISAQIKSMSYDDDRHVRADERNDFIEKGASSLVFGFDVAGTQYVAKAGRNTDMDRALSVENDVENLTTGRGIPRLEQVVAASREDGVVVSERMPGKDITHCTAEEMGAVTKDQLVDALAAMRAAFAAGIDFDSKPANFMYDPEQGFGFIDYARPGTPSDVRPYTDTLAVRGLVESLWAFGRESYSLEVRGVTNETDIYEKYAARGKYTEVEVQLYGLLRDALQESSGEYSTDVTPVIAQIEAHIDSRRELAENYKDPAWLVAHIARLKQEVTERVDRDTAYAAERAAAFARGDNPDIF